MFYDEVQVAHNSSSYCVTLSDNTSLTDEDEAGSDDVRQKVTSQRFAVLAITFREKANMRVKFIFTQTLKEKKQRRYTT